MRYKRIITVFLIFIIVMVCFWLSINRYTINDIKSLEDISRLFSMGEGYNFLVLHMSIYAMIFIMILRENMPDLSVQFVVRKTRVNYMLNNIRLEIIISTLFTVLFLSVEYILSYIYIPHQLIMQCHKSVLIAFMFFSLALWVLYIFIGAIYMLYDVIFISRVKAFVATFFTTILLQILVMNIAIPWPFPNAHMDFIKEYFSLQGLEITWAVFSIVEGLVITIAIFYITIILFKKKDIIEHED